MGRQSKWFLSFKRLFAGESDDKKNLKIEKSKESQFNGSKDLDQLAPKIAEATVCDAAPEPLPPPPIREVNVTEKEDGQSKHAYSVALASAVAAEAAAIAAQAAAAVVRLTANSAVRVTGKSKEETAAIKIQTTFRGYMAKKALRDLRRLVRLKEIIDGDAVKRQTSNTLHIMQALSKVQSQISSRKIRMTEENQSLRRQLQLKQERELEKLKTGEEWNASLHSKEKMEAKLLNKQEAAMRRERALAYAFSHQWKSSSRAVAPVFSDVNNPQWGWSWLERWMAARPWESRNAGETSDQASTKSANNSTVQEKAKTNVHHDSNSEGTPAVQRSRPPSRQSPFTPPSKRPSTPSSKPPPSPGGSKKSASPLGVRGTKDDDSRSTTSERMRRHSIGGSSDESSASSPAITSSVSSSVSAAKAKSQLHSPLKESARNSDKGSVISVKKRLSFPATADKITVSSPNARRLSVPPKVDIALLKDSVAKADRTTNNGGRR